MPEIVEKILGKRLDLVFFGAYIFSLPFTWRKVLSVSSLPPGASFNEYTSVSLYIGEILLFLALGIFVIEHINCIKSIYTQIMFHVEQKNIVLFFIGFLLSGLVSLTFSLEPILSVQSLLHIVEGALVFLYLLFQIVPRGTYNMHTPISKSSTWNIFHSFLLLLALTSVFQVILEIAQFIKQESLGLKFLGESTFSVVDPGIAKISLLGHLLIRPYGTFLHPNILAGFLALSFFIFFYSYRRQLFHVEHKTFHFLMALLLAGTLLTFSKTAILASIMALFVLCSTWNKNTEASVKSFKKEKVFHVEHISLFILIAVFILELFFQSYSYIQQSYSERVNLLPFTWEIIKNHPFLGVGPGQFVYNLMNNALFPLWQYQPIHNVFLLILSEFGLIGSIFLALFLKGIWKFVPRGTIEYQFTLALIMLLFVFSLSDHYLWDMYPVQMLFWITLGFIGGGVLLTKYSINDIA